MTYPEKILFAIFLLLLISACSTTQEGRKQLLLFNDQELDNMGFQTFKELKKQEPISTDIAKKNYIACIATPIIQAMDQNNLAEAWEVQLFASDQANAFALPGKKIGVYEGLLQYAVNQDQVAAVIGHELAHVTAKHGNERISQATLSQVGLSVLGLNSSTTAHLVLQYGVLLPYGRTQETEADLIGLHYMARAGFDPRESIPLWENMSRAGQKVPQFLSTHPSAESRMQRLAERIPLVLPEYNQAVSKKRRPDCEKYLRG